MNEYRESWGTIFFHVIFKKTLKQSNVLLKMELLCGKKKGNMTLVFEYEYTILGSELINKSLAIKGPMQWQYIWGSTGYVQPRPGPGIEFRFSKFSTKACFHLQRLGEVLDHKVKNRQDAKWSILFFK